MRLRRILAGLSCVGAGTGAGSVLYFSPSAKELAARRRKLLGLHGALGDDSDADSLHDGGAGQHGGAPLAFSDAMKEHARALGNPSGMFRFFFAAGTVAAVAWEYRQLRHRRTVQG